MCVSKGINPAMIEVTSGSEGLSLQNFYASVLLLFLILIMYYFNDRARTRNCMETEGLDPVLKL